MHFFMEHSLNMRCASCLSSWNRPDVPFTLIHRNTLKLYVSMKSSKENIDFRSKKAITKLQTAWIFRCKKSMLRIDRLKMYMESSFCKYSQNIYIFFSDIFLVRNPSKLIQFSKVENHLLDQILSKSDFTLETECGWKTSLEYSYGRVFKATQPLVFI